MYGTPNYFIHAKCLCTWKLYSIKSSISVKSSKSVKSSNSSKITKDSKKERKKKKEKKERKGKDKKERKKKSEKKCDTAPSIPQLRRHRSASDLKVLLQQSEVHSKVKSSTDSLCLYEKKDKKEFTTTNTAVGRRHQLRRVRSANDLKTVMLQDCSDRSSHHEMKPLMQDCSDRSSYDMKPLLMQDCSDRSAPKNPGSEGLPTLKELLATSEAKRKRAHQGRQPKDTSDMPSLCTYTHQSCIDSSCQSNQSGIDSSCQSNYSEATSEASTACPFPLAAPPRETSFTVARIDPLAVSSKSKKSIEDDLQETKDALDLMLGLSNKPPRRQSMPDHTSSFMSQSMTSGYSSDSSFSLGSEDISCLLDLSRRSEYSLMRLSVKGAQAEQRKSSSNHQASMTRTVPIEAPPATIKAESLVRDNNDKEIDLDAKSHDMDASEYLSCAEIEDDFELSCAFEKDLDVSSRGMVITTRTSSELDMSVLMDLSEYCGGKSVHSSSTVTTNTQSKNSTTSGVIHVLPTTAETASSSGGSSTHSVRLINGLTAAPTSSWKCGLCMVENEEVYKFCGMCANPRFWTCSVCQFGHNKSQFPHCGGCGSRRNQRPLVSNSPLNLSMAVAL